MLALRHLLSALGDRLHRCLLQPLGRIICNTLFLSYSAATMGSAWMGLFLYTWFIRVEIFRDFMIRFDSDSGCHNLIPKQLFTYISLLPVSSAVHLYLCNFTFEPELEFLYDLV